MTTPKHRDFTDRTAGFQLASHNYVPRLSPPSSITFPVTYSVPLLHPRLCLVMEGEVERKRKGTKDRLKDKVGLHIPVGTLCTILY